MSNRDYATAPSSQSPRLGMLTNPPLLHSPPAPTTSTSLTTTMLHGLAAPRTRFVVAGLTAVSLNVGSIPAACTLGALYVAGNGVNFYQVLCRPRADDDSTLPSSYRSQTQNQINNRPVLCVFFVTPKLSSSFLHNSSTFLAL